MSCLMKWLIECNMKCHMYLTVKFNSINSPNKFASIWILLEQKSSLVATLWLKLDIPMRVYSNSAMQYRLMKKQCIMVKVNVNGGVKFATIWNLPEKNDPQGTFKYQCFYEVTSGAKMNLILKRKYNQRKQRLEVTSS